MSPVVRLLVPVLFACTTTPVPAPRASVPAKTAAPAPAPVAAAEFEEDEDLIRPPPARRRREHLLTEKQYVGLMHAHPRGFQPDDCLRLCKDDVATEVSEDGRWRWTLRCTLKRNLREEPVVACREDAVDLRPKKRLGGPSTVVLSEE